jgi:SpoVK/Ycf46/Vps4 family AAA+-type ATPase
MTAVPTPRHDQPSVWLKAFTVLALCSAAATAAAKPPALSVCPPVIGERDMMLSSVSNVGTQKRYGELCKVPQATIQRNIKKSLDALQPCLSELGVKETDTAAALKEGEPGADEVFNRSGNKDLLCEKTREEFK